MILIHDVVCVKKSQNLGYNSLFQQTRNITENLRNHRIDNFFQIIH
jgi:hypothetical protein